MDGVSLYAKRALDIMLALGASIILSPILVSIALLVKLTSRGPVLYKQERVSLDGTRFAIYKFRTMFTNAEEHGPGWSKPGDDRVTPLGRVLRSLSLDELPQLFNVVRGEMSIVGPRPERPVFIEEFKQRVPRYMLRHKVPAGMTGWAQVNGWRGETGEIEKMEMRVRYDLYYVNNWSLWFDLRIIFMTFFMVVVGKNAH